MSAIVTENPLLGLCISAINFSPFPKTSTIVAISFVLSPTLSNSRTILKPPQNSNNKLVFLPQCTSRQSLMCLWAHCALAVLHLAAKILRFLLLFCGGFSISFSHLFSFSIYRHVSRLAASSENPAVGGVCWLIRV